METSRAFLELAPFGQEYDVPPDAMLWREGDPAADVVLLLEGFLEVTHQSPEGGEVVIRRLEPGAVLGEIASMDNSTRSAAVKAASRCRIIRIPAEKFRDTVRERPDLLEELFWQQVQRVRSLTEQLVTAKKPTIVDRLTRAYNSPFFRDRLRDEMDRAQETGDELCVALFDIDHLSTYNEAHSHEKGSELVVAVAELLRATGRRGDVIARFAGGTFAVLLYGAYREDGRKFAEKVRVRVEETSFPGAGSQPLGKVTVSAGVSNCPADGERVDSLMEPAELNLATAKEQGRNRVVADPPPAG